jgi:hypothetical protein
MNTYDRVTHLINEMLFGLGTKSRKPKSKEDIEKENDTKYYTPVQAQAARTKAIGDKDAEDFKLKQQRDHEIQLAKIKMGYPVKTSRTSLDYSSPNKLIKPQ